MNGPHEFGWGHLADHIDKGTHFASRADAGHYAKRLRDAGYASVKVVANPQGRGHVVEVYKSNGWLIGALKVAS